MDNSLFQYLDTFRIRQAHEAFFQDTLQTFNQALIKHVIEELHIVGTVVQSPLYTILEEAVAKGHKFEFPVYWGVDLASEHERYLVEDHFKRPVILTDYPKEIKAFYMKQKDAKVALCVAVVLKLGGTVL